MMAAFALGNNAPLEWHVAAAVVQQVANQLTDGRIRRVPAAASLAIDQDGAVHVRPAPSDAWQPDGLSAAAGLRELLRELVGTGGIPPALDAVMQSSNGGAALESADAVGRAMGFFVRPYARADLAGIAERLREREEEARLQREMEAVTRQARSAERPAEDASTRVRPEQRKRLNRRALVAAVAAVGALLLAVFIAAQPGPAGPMLAQGRALLKDAREAANAVLSPEAPVTTTPAAEPAAAESLPAAAVRRSSVRIAPSGSPANVPRPLTAAASPWALSPVFSPFAVSTSAPDEAHRSETGAPAAADARAATPPSDHRIYDQGDGDVIPAVLVPARLPSRPRLGTVGLPVGRLEVVISSSGQVENVRLLETTLDRRYYDSMLLPAVKAWMFTPARRGGVPVRYRLEVLLRY